MLWLDLLRFGFVAIGQLILVQINCNCQIKFGFCLMVEKNIGGFISLFIFPSGIRVA